MYFDLQDNIKMNERVFIPAAIFSLTPKSGNLEENAKL
jgi:hypothetical protein